MAKMSVSGDSRDASDNTPMTIGEIATAVAKKKTKGATKKRAAAFFQVAVPKQFSRLVIVIRGGDR